MLNGKIEGAPEAADTNVASTTAAPPDADNRLRPRDARQERMAQRFSQVVAVLMRDPNFKKRPIGDLEWLVLPPLMAGQFALGQAPAPGTTVKNKEGGMLVPVTVALWARVSAAIDKRLTEAPDQPALLAANEWASGDNLWLMTAAGDPRAMPTFLEQLAANEFKDKQVKLRGRDTNGNVVIRMLKTSADKM